MAWNGRGIATSLHSPRGVQRVGGIGLMLQEAAEEADIQLGENWI